MLRRYRRRLALKNVFERINHLGQLFFANGQRRLNTKDIDQSSTPFSLMAARTLPAPATAGALVSRPSTSSTKELRKIDQIWFIVHATGSSEIYAEFNAKSISDLNDFITQKVNKIDGLLKTETSLVLKYIKRRYDWKTAIR